MGPVILELRCPQNVDGIAVDPEPDWSFDSILLELNSIEKKLNASPIPYAKPYALYSVREFSAVKGFEKSPRAFIMRVSDEEMEDTEFDSDGEEILGQPLASGRRFPYISDSEDSENELALEGKSYLMEKVEVVDGALSELTHEHQLGVTEEVRNQILALEIDLANRNEKFTSAIARVEKNAEARREMEKKLDLQFHRTVAEDLDKYLTGVQRKHEHRSQIEERRIRDDAAIEDAKRRQEEKHRQEKIKAEAEARLEAEKKRAEEEAKALEAQRAAKEAAEKVVTENSIKAATAAATSQNATAQSTGTRADGSKKVSAGNFIKGAESALKLEERRSQIYKEVAAEIETLGLRENKDFSSHGKQIARRIKTINGTRENVRTKADELIKLITQSAYPQASIAMFAEKVVSQCVNPTGSFSNAVYAYGHVVVLVTSQVPRAMEILLAELNRICIFTVPKYMSYSKSTFETEEVYYKAIGYQEEDGKIESTDTYVARVMSCMKLYGALVQTEVEGFRNLHGIEEGWAWIARFLNALPANLYTAVALQAFLEMAGFALYTRYRSQFKKLLNIISHNFLNALGQREDPRLTKVVMSIQDYIDSKQYLKEPEGWRLQSSLLSHQFVPESDYQEKYHHHSPNRYFY